MDSNDWVNVVRLARECLPAVQEATRAETRATCSYALALLGAVGDQYARDRGNAGRAVGRGEVATAPDPEWLTPRTDTTRQRGGGV